MRNWPRQSGCDRRSDGPGVSEQEASNHRAITLNPIEESAAPIPTPQTFPGDTKPRRDAREKASLLLRLLIQLVRLDRVSSREGLGAPPRSVSYREPTRLVDSCWFVAPRPPGAIRAVLGIGTGKPTAVTVVKTSCVPVVRPSCVPVVRR